ncbi:MAG: YraN family protein [Candidatus Moranbacteria bacterium]|jgi:putative endonuclease|nr:YraN family protein [Candidatus Moranbacteria bacterium]
MFWNKNKEKNIGGMGEKVAGKYLKKKGFKIIEFNYQNKTGKRLGEIDIVTKKDKQIVFVEVKSRISDGITVVLPEENITRDKLDKLQKIINAYVREKNLWECDYRLDAVSILFGQNGKDILEIRHLESIFY